MLEKGETLIYVCVNCGDGWCIKNGVFGVWWENRTLFDIVNVMSFCPRVILKPCGPIFGQINPLVDHFTNRGYGLMWIFHEPSSPLSVPHDPLTPLQK